jgi:hypothetical protein
MMAARCAAGLRRWHKQYMCFSYHEQLQVQGCDRLLDVGRLQAAAASVV